MQKTWLEAALNGAWTRARQPRIPVRVSEIVAEGIACARAGAAIIHVHAYDEASGRQRDSAEAYARIIEGIREAVDCIVYPTVPFGRAGMPASERFAAVEELGRRGLLEWAVVDPGSVNIEGAVYMNPEQHVRHGLALAQEFRFHPGYAIYEAGFLRAGAALARTLPGLPQPIYRFMFTRDLQFGFPPAEYALQAYLRLLADEAPGARWMIAGLAVDVLDLARAAVQHGGHVRVGLEDAPLGSPRSNLDWVCAGRRSIEDAGGELASAAEVRAALTDP